MVWQKNNLVQSMIVIELDLNGYDIFANRLFMCQDENENKPKDKSFRSFWIKPVTNEPGLSTTIH